MVVLCYWFGLRNGAWINKWSTDYENAASCFCGNDRYADGDSRLGIGIYRFAGVYISNRPEFRELAAGKILGVVQYPVIIMLVLAVLAAFILRKTVIGRHVYAIGSNEEAARLSGINTHGVRIFAYVFCAAMASIAGILVTSRANSGQPNIGIGYEADAIAACVIGGASMNGGHGCILGTILGALVIGILSNGLNLIQVSTNWQTVATGVVLIIAVYLDIVRQKKRMGKK